MRARGEIRETKWRSEDRPRPVLCVAFLASSPAGRFGSPACHNARRAKPTLSRRWSLRLDRNIWSRRVLHFWICRSGVSGCAPATCTSVVVWGMLARGVVASLCVRSRSFEYSPWVGGCTSCLCSLDRVGTSRIMREAPARCIDRYRITGGCLRSKATGMHRTQPSSQRSAQTPGDPRLTTLVVYARSRSASRRVRELFPRCCSLWERLAFCHGITAAWQKLPVPEPCTRPPENCCSA